MIASVGKDYLRNVDSRVYFASGIYISSNGEVFGRILMLLSNCEVLMGLGLEVTKSRGSPDNHGEILTPCDARVAGEVEAGE